ncbi:MAG: hypothetical protein ACLFV0_04400 [Nitriliruptoraceae bacterium]
MFDELLAVVADLLDASDACGPCAGNPPDAGPTVTGAAGAAGAGGDGGGDRRRGGREDREPEWHEEPGHEREWQRDNAEETVTDLIVEFLTEPSRNLGKVTGPLITVAAASDVLADGVSTVTEANQRREERIYEQTGGEMGTPASGGDPTHSHDRGGGSGETSGQRGGAGDGSSSDDGRREAERVLDDIRIKLEIERNGYGDDESWKDWGR